MDQGGGVSGKVKRLSVGDRRFLEIYFDHRGDGTAAYLAWSAERGKTVTKDSAGCLASRKLSKIKKTADFQEQLEAAGLGTMDILAKAAELLGCQRPIIDFKTGAKVGEAPDGVTQARVLELVSSWHGLEAPKTLKVEEISIGLPPKPEGGAGA